MEMEAPEYVLGITGICDDLSQIQRLYESLKEIDSSISYKEKTCDAAEFELDVYKRQGKSIGAKIFTSLICSIVIAVLLVGENIIFYGLTVGFGDVTRSIQSVYGYMESCLKINVWQYMVLSVVTKAMVMFAISTILIFVAVITKHVFAMYLAGGLVALVAALAYGLIPAYSTWSWAKYLNFVGILKTQNLYGAYLNLNIAGEPVSRTKLSLIILMVYIIIGTLAAVISFLKFNNMEYVKTGITLHKRKKVPGNLMGHECYKIMIVNSGLIVFIIFSMLIGYKIFSKQYNVSPVSYTHLFLRNYF